MRLNWFSPLPPARTEIAAWTARLLPELSARAEVVLWTDQDEVDPALARHAEVRRYDPREGPAGLCRGVNVYNLGNHPRHHAGPWRVSRQYPGLVVLHDLGLQHLFAGLHLDARDRAGFVALMERHYGDNGRWAAEAYWGNRLPIEFLAGYFPLTAAALEGAAGVVVHNRAAFDALRRIGLPAVHAELPYPATPRRRLERPAGPPFRLIVFGHLGPNRRLPSLLHALAQCPAGDRFRLDVYGPMRDGQGFEALIGSLGLADRVSVHGFVADAELEEALASAHLAVNLRFPTMGEASASQLRIWDHALPSLVSRVGWYADLPEDAVAFVYPHREVADVEERLAEFAARPDHFTALGANGRRRLEERHSPEGYVRRVLELAGQVRCAA
jgi:glycosyltransferase involved in cell wall biosynthesis